MSAMATAPPLMGFQQPPSYEETMVAPPPPHYHMGPPPPQGYASGPPPPPQGYNPGPPPPQGYSKMPQYLYPPQAVGPPVTSPMVSVQTIYVQPGQVLGDRPVQTHCPACSQVVQTRIEHQAGTMTWLSCLALAFFGCIYGCCLIPFCANSLRDVKHICPNCNSFLGLHKRL